MALGGGTWRGVRFPLATSRLVAVALRVVFELVQETLRADVVVACCPSSLSPGGAPSGACRKLPRRRFMVVRETSPTEAVGQSASYHRQ